MFFWPERTEDVLVVLSESVYNTLLEEAKESLQEVNERATILIGKIQDDHFICDAIIRHEELLRNGLVCVRKEPDESWEGMNKGLWNIRLYMEYIQIVLYLLKKGVHGKNLIFAHSHDSHPDLFDPSPQDREVSHDIRCVAMVFTARDNMLFALAFKGESNIEVVWR